VSVTARAARLAQPAPSPNDPIPWVPPGKGTEHALQWHPGHHYSPETGDFERFQSEIMAIAQPIFEGLMQPLASNPELVRERSRHLIQFRYYLDGAITTAEHYLTAARNRASQLEPPANSRCNAEQLKMRMELLYADEKRLVSWLTRIRESLHNEVIYAESELKLLGEEMRMAGYETR
jgi:hypothetical protein